MWSALVNFYMATMTVVFYPVCNFDPRVWNNFIWCHNGCFIKLYNCFYFENFETPPQILFLFFGAALVFKNQGNTLYFTNKTCDYPTNVNFILKVKCLRRDKKNYLLTRDLFTPFPWKMPGRHWKLKGFEKYQLFCKNPYFQ